MRRLVPAAQEDLRLRVIAALESGRVGTYGQAAEMFGVSSRSVGTWWRAFQAGGRQALLVAVRQPRAGVGELLNDSARGAVLRAMRDCTPADIGLSGVLWARASVRALIKLVCGVSMTEQGVGKWLRRHGFTPQRSARRSYRQQPEAVRAWLEEEYPAIAARAKGEKAGLVWADQCGLRSDTAPPGRSWAPTGHIPLVRVNGRRFKVNIMSAVASRGALWFTVFPGKFTAKVMCAFLDRLARQADRKVHVIADRHPVHRSKAVRAWLDENAERIELHLMSG
ncbi:IS630 family transposase [Streptomyces sp. NPDC059455]|uniref:IS630 family transposase n=1 Tax=Streptomyces sp. NPDC059455 TaxID=3346837 RepID=UPI00368681CC